ncbi:MAG: hypothetical protein WD397_04120 [Wenzhouxiangellaceae bacterium]
MSADPNPNSQRIADYVRGRLSEDEVQRFETQMLEDDDLFARVQREDLLRRGLQTTNVEQPASPRRFPAWLQPALTGALAVAVVGLGIANLGLRDRLEQLQAPRTGIPVITLHDQRALLPDEQMEPARRLPGDGPALLEIDVSAYEEQEFQVEIRTARDTYTYERVRADARGYVTLLLTERASGIELKTVSGKNIGQYSIEY